jgi:hypothetical protein
MIIALEEKQRRRLLGASSWRPEVETNSNSTGVVMTYKQDQRMKLGQPQ